MSIKNIIKKSIQMTNLTYRSRVLTLLLIVFISCTDNSKLIDIHESKMTVGVGAIMIMRGNAYKSYKLNLTMNNHSAGFTQDSLKNIKIVNFHFDSSIVEIAISKAYIEDNICFIYCDDVLRSNNINFRKEILRACVSFDQDELCYSLVLNENGMICYKRVTDFDEKFEIADVIYSNNDSLNILRQEKHQLDH